MFHEAIRHEAAYCDTLTQTAASTEREGGCDFKSCDPSVQQ
ncbi:hypothetical protein E6C60_0119 [Paenibacillus algicola]|uniref:Uncharacterized protein n=1 Tax=Paenibacillus algicola TaxID=2565926 RepID=A0A4P8XEU4_9BACL|nr:hypothetical protein E6C60_0119 [Paenibacillus algicola]